MQYNHIGNGDLYITLQNLENLSTDVYKVIDVHINGYNCSLNQDKASFMFTTKQDSDAVILSTKMNADFVCQIQDTSERITNEVFKILSNNYDISKNIKIGINRNNW
ncbi:MAG: hypothetical protein PV340_04520 [Wolbachia sp.]|nr:hypothetical protein [Wolbachia sp.]MDD9336012.1 hypothetical protein [Wolbachia sp.]